MLMRRPRRSCGSSPNGGRRCDRPMPTRWRTSTRRRRARAISSATIRSPRMRYGSCGTRSSGRDIFSVRPGPQSSLAGQTFPTPAFACSTIACPGSGPVAQAGSCVAGHPGRCGAELGQAGGAALGALCQQSRQICRCPQAADLQPDLPDIFAFPVAVALLHVLLP